VKPVRVDDKRCRAILIQPGTIGQVDDIEDTLQAFRRVLGGHVEHIGAADGRISFGVNENGKLENMPVNRLAHRLMVDARSADGRRDTLNGPVIITGGPTRHGDNTPVPRWMVKQWRRLAYSAIDWS
jgi:hypothetical protein